MHVEPHRIWLAFLDERHTVWFQSSATHVVTLRRMADRAFADPSLSTTSPSILAARCLLLLLRVCVRFVDEGAFTVTLMSLLRRERLYRSALGFRKRDLERGLALISHLNTAQREGALMLMRKCYNGCLFSGCTEPLFNPTLSLFFLKQVQRDVAGVDLLDELLDDNVKLSPSFLAVARKLPAGERCVTRWRAIRRR